MRAQEVQKKKEVWISASSKESSSAAVNSRDVQLAKANPVEKNEDGVSWGAEVTSKPPQGARSQGRPDPVTRLSTLLADRLRGRSAKTLFRAWDVEKLGAIKKKEMKSMLDRLGIGMSTEDIDVVYKAVDTSGSTDGGLRLNEFVRLANMEVENTEVRKKAPVYELEDEMKQRDFSKAKGAKPSSDYRYPNTEGHKPVGYGVLNESALRDAGGGRPAGNAHLLNVQELEEEYEAKIEGEHAEYSPKKKKGAKDGGAVVGGAHGAPIMRGYNRSQALQVANVGSGLDADAHANMTPEVENLVNMLRGRFLLEPLGKVFRNMDYDKDGHVTAEEMRSVFDRLGYEKVKSEHIGQLVACYDRGESGRLNFNDMKRLLGKRSSGYLYQVAGHEEEQMFGPPPKSKWVGGGPWERGVAKKAVSARSGDDGASVKGSERGVQSEGGGASNQQQPTGGRVRRRHKSRGREQGAGQPLRGSNVCSDIQSRLRSHWDTIHGALDAYSQQTHSFGRIERGAFIEVLGGLDGVGFSGEELALLVTALDPNDRGAISFGEFASQVEETDDKRTMPFLRKARRAGRGATKATIGKSRVVPGKGKAVGGQRKQYNVIPSRMDLVEEELGEDGADDGQDGVGAVWHRLEHGHEGHISTRHGNTVYKDTRQLINDSTQRRNAGLPEGTDRYQVESRQYGGESRRDASERRQYEQATAQRQARREKNEHRVKAAVEQSDRRAVDRMEGRAQGIARQRREYTERIQRNGNPRKPARVAAW
jgi:Ca2+-binding EF-hand superfamily protein